MTDRTGQNSIQALSVGGVRETSPASSTGVKWHPGHYLNTGTTSLGLYDTTTSRGNIPSFITETASMPTIKGIMVRVFWGALETTEGTYKFDVVDQLLALAQASEKRFVLAVDTSTFGADLVDYQVSQGRFPAYLRDTYNGLRQNRDINNPTAQGRVDAKLWTAPVMDRLIALYQALAARYDTNPYFEGIATAETSIGTTSPDWSSTAWLTQAKRLVVAAEAAWTHTNVFVGYNGGFNGDAAKIEFMQHLVAHRMVLSNPDMDVSSFLLGNGGGAALRIYVGTTGGVDYRGQIAAGLECESPNLGGSHTPTAADLDPATTMQTIYGPFGQTLLHQSYYFWERKTFGYTAFGTDNDVFWDTAPSPYTNNHPTIKEFLAQSEATIPVVTTPPSNYAAVGVDTS